MALPELVFDDSFGIPSRVRQTQLYRGSPAGQTEGLLVRELQEVDIRFDTNQGK